MLIITLIIAGILLISAELLVPGGILGTLGGITLLAACYFTYVDYGIWAAAALFVACGLLTFIVIYLQVKILRKTSFARKIFLDATSGGGSLQERADKSVPADLIGKRGETLTTLSPTGKVVIEGIAYEASLQNGLLRRGHTVEVIGRDAFRLIVKGVD